MRFVCAIFAASLLLQGCPAPSGTRESAAASSRKVPLTVTAAPSMSGRMGRAIFVVYRPAGAPYAGAPLEVQKIDQPSYPLSIDIDFGKKDSANADADVYLRFDADGDL